MNNARRRTNNAEDETNNIETPLEEAHYEATLHDALQQFLLPIAVFCYKHNVRSFRLLARCSASHEAVLPAVLVASASG
jgi:hypothetical protein